MKPDWSTAPDWAMFAAMDYDRQWCWHSHEPRLSGKVWMPPEDGTWKRASELDQRDWRDTLERRAHEPATTQPERSGDAVDAARDDAWGDFECEFLTDGNGYAPAATYKACTEAFDAAWPDKKAAHAAAKAAYSAIHPASNAERHAARYRFVISRGKLPIRCSGGYYYEDGILYPTAETAIDAAMLANGARPGEGES